MRLPFHVRRVALLFGAGGHTTEFFANWLRGQLPSPQASHVWLAHAVTGTRRELLVQSVLAELRPTAKVLTWGAFLEHGGQCGDVVVAAHGDDAGDFAVALELGDATQDADARVEVWREGDLGWTLPMPAVAPAVLAPFAVGLGVLVARHGARPGRTAEQHQGHVRVAQARISVAQQMPLKLRQHELRRVETGSRTVSLVCPPGNVEVDVAARAMVDAGRNFDRFMATRSTAQGDVALCFNGPSCASPRGLGAWAVHVPQLWGAEGLVVETLTWHRFAQRFLADSGVVATHQLGHSLGRVSAAGRADAVLADLPDLSELTGEFGAVRRAYGRAGRVDAASAEQNLWQAWVVLGPRDAVDAAVAKEPLVEVIESRGPLECVIAGFPDAIDGVMLELLNTPRIHATEIPLDVALHSRAALELAAHLDAAFGVHGLAGPQDVAPDVLAAWNQGVRVFIDVGPRAGFAHWIPRILEGKPHHVVALDPGMHGPLGALDALVKLDALGLQPTLDALHDVFCEAPKHHVPLPNQTEPDWLAVAQTLQNDIVAAHRRHIARQSAAFTDALRALTNGLDPLRR